MRDTREILSRQGLWVTLIELLIKEKKKKKAYENFCVK